MYDFIERIPEISVGRPIWYTLRKKRVKGDIGLEIEAEGENFEKDAASLLPYWEYHIDHSLRGPDNAEYVLKKPLTFAEAGKALDVLWDIFEDKKTILLDSNRTSVHAHLNCQNFHLNRLASFAAIWFTLEEILVEWCGDHRVGNLFCLRGKDAPAIIHNIKNFITSEGRGSFPDNLHYACFNVHALQKFGSIEIRSLRGVPDKETIKTWVDILERLYKLSEEYPDPREFVGEFSAYGPLDFYYKIMGPELGDKVIEEANISYDTLKDAMYEGIRLAQDIAYCRDWSVFKGEEPSVDPFGRVKKPYSETLNITGQSGSFTAQSHTIQLSTTLQAYAEMANNLNIAPAPWTPPTELDDDDFEDEEF